MKYIPKKPKIFEKLEQLAPLVPTAFYWVDVDSTIIGGNQSALEMIKEVSSSCKNIIGKNAFDMFPPKAAKDIISNNVKTVKAKKPLVFEETVTDIKTKRKKFRNVIRAPLYENKKIVGILILVTDLTKNKEKTQLELEKQLKFKTLVDQTAYEFKSPLAILLVLINQCSGKPKDKVFETLSMLADLTPISLYWFDENNILLSSNKWDSESVGGKFVGKTPFDYFPYEIANNLVKNNQMVMKTGKILSYDEQLRNASTGEINYYRAYKAPLHDNKGKTIGILGTSMNVTTEKNAEQLKLENELQKVKLKEQEKYEIMVTQLAHDIRSPTASLSMIIDTCKNIPEKERVTLIHAANRITDIANNLLNSYKKTSAELYTDSLEQQYVLTSLALSRIVSEKRKQLNNSLIAIEVHYQPKSEFSFIKANLLNFERMISNVLNNSFEAIEAIKNKKGKIDLILSKEDNHVKVIIKDNGTGMPQTIIDKIIDGIPVTTGKQHGHGIGFTQVRETLKNSNGKISIESTLDVGTKITLSFPIVDTPDWIAKQISIPEKSIVVVLDDDPSIHGAWELRFKNHENIINLKHLSSGKKAIDFINSFTEKNKIFLLADFELIEQNMNGLQVIEQTGMSKQSFLVTSHYNKKQIVKTASKAGIKILPKQLASSISIKITKQNSNRSKKVDLVIIEDNKIFAESLTIFLKNQSLNVDIYNTPQDFLKNSYKYSKKTKICTDNEFGSDAITGIELAKQLYQDGYKQLFLLSGKEFEKNQTPKFLNVILKGDISALNQLL